MLRGEGEALLEKELDGHNNAVIIIRKVTSAQSVTTGRRAA